MGPRVSSESAPGCRRNGPPSQLGIRNHPRKPDGILYRARHDPARTCAAIFDRAQSVLTPTEVGTLAADMHRNLLGDILDTYGFALIP